MTLEEKFSKLIKDELPGKVGNELKQVLLKAEEDAREREKFKSLYEKEILAKQEFKEELQETKKLLYDQKEFDKKVKEFEEEKKRFEISVLKIQLEEANKRADIVKEYTATLVRNPIIKKNVFDSENKQVPYVDQYGNPSLHNVCNNKSYTETKETE